MPAAPDHRRRPPPPPPHPPAFQVTANDLVPQSHESAVAKLTLPYRLYVPRDYLQSQRYSLLLILHGSGERGSDNLGQLQNGVLAWCDPALQRQHPTFVVYPQCPAGARWVDAAFAPGRYAFDRTPESRPLIAARELIAVLGRRFTIDPDRVLVNGLSMGGFAAWDLVTRHPELWAGAMPICGGGDPSHVAAGIRVPIWAFHGGADDTVDPAGARATVEAFRKAGGQVTYTEYPKVGHAAWEKVFADKRALRWLLAQKRTPPAKPPTRF